MCKYFQCPKSNYKYGGGELLPSNCLIFIVKQYSQYVCSMKKVLVLFSVLNITSLYTQDIYKLVSCRTFYIVP